MLLWFISVSTSSDGVVAGEASIVTCTVILDGHCMAGSDLCTKKVDESMHMDIS
jgi:hypothetical protein